jgi:DNA-binding CsgD family transcriptional regulator
LRSRRTAPRRGSRTCAPAAGVEALTPSERRVAQLAAEGLTNREIAQMLFVTARTVETHLMHVFAKLDVDSRAVLPSVLGSSGAQPGSAARPTAPTV